MGDGYMDIHYIILRAFLFEIEQKKKKEREKKSLSVFMETHTKERKCGWLHSISQAR